MENETVRDYMAETALQSMEKEVFPFHDYPEIENSYQQGFIEKIKERGYGDISYVVTEKVHGSNSQLTYDLREKKFYLGSRNHYLGEDEKFYNLQLCLEPLKPSVARLAECLSNDLAKFGQHVTSVTVFGEICGGTYPHKDVMVDKTAIKVQKGVFYSYTNCWLAYDIGYMTEGASRMYFLTASSFIDTCLLAQLPFVPVLGIRDSLDEALAFPNDGVSKVHEKYCLPEIEGNIMEGVVIRPLYEDVWFGYTRLILKNKNDKFKEKWRAKKTESVAEEIPEKVKQAMEEISQYITRNRVRNVISHLGEVTEKDIGKVIMLTGQDVLKDYRKEYDTMQYLEKKEEKMVTKYMNGEVAKAVRDVIVYQKD